MSTKELSKSIKQLQSLNALYKNDEYMCEKLHLYVQNNLPNIMKNIKISNDQRVSRANVLNNEFH